MGRPKTVRGTPAAVATRDRDVAHAIEGWFEIHARNLPWRTVIKRVKGSPRRDPYHALVSELMLQQTQVSRVVERFRVFIERFPRVEDLAAAHEDEVLALWSGLGYYRRARLLHAAARHVTEKLGGDFPRDAAAIKELPGVGRYTAGSIASIALGERTPVVDGNVVRVLLRLEGRDGRHGDKGAESWAWERATELVEHAKEPGGFNEGMMELGATVCAPPPAMPRCDACPVATWCVARKEGRQGEIPQPRVAGARKVMYCAAVVVRDAQGRVAVQQRGAGGMWARLWQAPTLERMDRASTAAELGAWLGHAEARLERVGAFEHTTTHREVRFEVWRVEGEAGRVPGGEGWRWVAESELAGLGMSSVQARILRQ